MVEAPAKGTQIRSAWCSPHDCPPQDCFFSHHPELESLGCSVPMPPIDVKCVETPTAPLPRIYLAGPMRGYDLWNFPAFDAAAEVLEKKGWTVVSPATLDREAGFDEHVDHLPEGFMAEAMRRDVGALLDVHAVALLPGWHRSEGCALEMSIAQAIGLPIFTLENGDLVAFSETILEEAARLVHGDRGRDYGHPIEDFTRTGRLWGALLGTEDVPPEKVGLCMVALKLSRECNRHKRDSLTDAAGYLEATMMVFQHQGVEA